MTAAPISILLASIRRLAPLAALLFAVELLASAYPLIFAGTPILEYLLPHEAAAGGLLAALWAWWRLSNRNKSSSSAGLGYLEHLPHPALIVDAQGKIRAANSAAAGFCHSTPPELLNQPVHALFHPPHLTQAECPLCRHIASGFELPSQEFSFGNKHWHRISLNRAAAADPAWLLQLHIDIAAYKQASEQLALVIDGAELGYWDWDYATGAHQVNQRWLNMLGLNQDDLDHFVGDWNNRIHPEDRDRVRLLIEQHIQSDKPYVVEFRMRHKQGHWVWIQGSGAVVERDPVSGQPIRLCGTHQDISPRKRSEQALQATYHIISQSASVALEWQCAPGLPVEFATENVERLLGYSAEQLRKGRLPYLNMIHPDDLAGFQLELESARHDPGCHDIVHMPYRLINANGDIKWVQDQKLIRRDEQGQVTAYRGLVTDITRQHQQNHAISNIISGSVDKSTRSPLDTLALLATETLGADFVLVGEIRPGLSVNTLAFCSHDPTSVETYALPAELCKAIASGQICRYTQDFHLSFEKEPWLQRQLVEACIGVPLQSGNQRIFGYAAAMYQRPVPDPQFAEDMLQLFALQITSELERADAMQALEEQKQRLLDAQNLSHIGDWQWHWQDNCFSWSDEMYCITGTNRTNFIPSFAGILAQVIHPDDRAVFKTSLQNAGRLAEIDLKHRIVLENGNIRHVHQRGKLIFDQKNRAIGLRGTMQDITERLQTEQRLLEAKQEAEKATRVKSEFLANMSHEIRTPMNAIVGLIDLCLNSQLSDKQRDYLERAETAAHGLTSLIDDILDFSKMESGKLQLVNSPFWLNEMLYQVVATMSELCRRKGLQLKCHPPILAQAVIGDAQRLRQILINLVGNAVKFTHQGYIEISLRILQHSEQTVTLEFAIKDTGIGMTEAQQAKLFKAFSQGDSSVTRNYGGTGLGLAISKQLLQQMGSDLKVDSAPQAGSCFTFSLTLELCDADFPHIAQAQTAAPLQQETLHGARILLVEDNEVNRIVAIDLLAQAGIEADTAENGEIALQKLERNRYDCVLLDVQMPVLDGYQTARRLRNIPSHADTPVIALTANVMSDDRDKCLQAGMNDFIGKPIRPATLYSTLAKWLSPKALASDKPTPANAGQALPALHGIDHETGLRHTNGNLKIYRKILQKFVDNHTGDLEKIDRAIDSHDWDAAKMAVHTLKGLSGSLGATQLQNLLIELEQKLKEPSLNEKDIASIAELTADSEQELRRIVASIRNGLAPENAE